MFYSLTSLFQVANAVVSFNQSHMSGKIICLILFIGSIFAWFIMITKIRDLRRAAWQSQRMLNAYRQGAHPVALFLKRQKFEATPLNDIYIKTCDALASALDARGADPSDLFAGGVGSSERQLGVREMGYVENVASRTVADQALMLDGSMGFLATAVTAAPFLGLLGTVWGVMIAFGNMGSSGGALLADVAPGISSALLTTVVGLLVALPSSIGYNILASQIRSLRVSMDNFVQELMADMERHFLE